MPFSSTFEWPPRFLQRSCVGERKPRAAVRTQRRPSTQPSLAQELMSYLRGQELYDLLYSTGYHSNINSSRARELLSVIHAIIAQSSTGINSVLDVGCSHGFAVKALWDAGIRASGIDVSHAAIAAARKAREYDRNPKPLCIHPCFQQASVAALPWSDQAFDAVMSSDVLEHLQLDEVDLAVSEIARVTRRFLILKVSNRGEGKKGGLAQTRGRLNASLLQRLPSTLHSTVRHSDWWISKFERHGFRMRSWVPTAGWGCCAFVMQRQDFSCSSCVFCLGDTQSAVDACCNMSVSRTILSYLNPRSGTYHLFQTVPWCNASLIL